MAQNETEVGMPALLYLENFGALIGEVFGRVPRLVGSTLHSKTHRDVDVRLVLPDAEYVALLGPRGSCERANPRWVGMCAAFSALGERMTGLPIDFQIQMESWANERYRDLPCLLLGRTWGS